MKNSKKMLCLFGLCLCITACGLVEAAEKAETVQTPVEVAQPIESVYTVVQQKESEELPFGVLEFLNVPGLGERVGNIRGSLNVENAGNYACVTIIHMPDGLSYLKPSMNTYLSPVSADGSFAARFHTDHNSDFFAPGISLYFVESGYIQSFTTEPGQEWAVSQDSISELEGNSLLSVRIERE
jgi:hypothetical protein